MRLRLLLMLVIECFGDTALNVGFLMERRALLLDLADIHALASRKVPRLNQASRDLLASIKARLAELDRF